MMFAMMVAALSLTACGGDDGTTEDPQMEEGENTTTLISTLIISGTTQPILVGGVITNFNKENVSKKGVIVSKNEYDLFITDNAKMELPTVLQKSNQLDYNSPKNIRYYDCTDINSEEYLLQLYYLEGNTDYYIRAFMITEDNNVLYGNTETVHTPNFNRYNGRADYANVWHAFDNTLFDLSTDEIIDPYEGFYYSTNENPRSVKKQVGISYNSCYKFLTEWNYKLWYYHNVNHSDIAKMVSIPQMKMVNGKLKITKAESDKDKIIDIYYSINGDGNRPENFINKYTEPLNVSKNSIVHCYAISNEGYMSYTNSFIVLN